MFEQIEPYPGDPILTLAEVFLGDSRPNKVNLSIGLYYDEDGRVPLLGSVRSAEAARLADQSPRNYLPMEGAANYRQAVQELVFGKAHEAVRSKRIASIQSIGGSGGLKVGSDFLKRYFPNSQVWVSTPLGKIIARYSRGPASKSTTTRTTIRQRMRWASTRCSLH